jgi:hypothetical protein
MINSLKLGGAMGITTNNLTITGRTKWKTVPLVNPLIGQQWTGRDNPGGAYGSSVTYSPELNLFVSVSNINYGTNELSNQRNTSYSSNGNTWTVGYTPNNKVGYNGVCWSPELGIFVAVGSNGFAYSTNGTTWTASAPITGTSRDATKICWAGGAQSKFVATLDSGGGTLTSPDGINWTYHNNLITGFYLPTIAYSPELNIFVQIGGNNLSGPVRLVSSTDGINWTPRTAPYAYQYVDICWAPERGIFSAVASTWGYPQMVANSSDGINWTPHNVPVNPHYFNCICWSAEQTKFVIMGAMTTTYARSNVMTSL